jgi:hypothetical protein
MNRVREFDPELRTEHDRRLAWSNGRLFDKLKRHCLGRMMTGRLFEEARQIVNDHTTQARLHGIEWPPLAVICLRGVGALEIIRADILPRDLEVWAVNLTVKYPQIIAREIAEALVEHFPGYRPDSIEFRRRKVVQEVEDVGMTGAMQ